jgi:hypothetical protein
MNAPDTAIIDLNGRKVILHRQTRVAKFRAGLVKDWGSGFALLVNWAWACLPKTEWDKFPEPIDLAEMVGGTDEKDAEFAREITKLFPEEKKEQGNADGSASSASPALPSESAPPSGNG